MTAARRAGKLHMPDEYVREKVTSGLEAVGDVHATMKYLPQSSRRRRSPRSQMME